MAKAQTARAVAQSVAGEIRAFCERKADPERAAKYARYFREGYDAWGIHEDPEWTRGIQQWSERLQAAGPLKYLDAGDLLVKTGKYEEASAAIRMAEMARGRYTPEVLARLGGWFDGGIRNWGHTDVFCALVLGPFLTGKIVDVETFCLWRDSPHKYQRRAVPVTLLELLKAGAAVRPLLAAVEPLMMDSERVVQQGMGWFLREAWKRDAAPVEKLLLRYKDRAPRLIFQYATEKMTSQERERFRKEGMTTPLELAGMTRGDWPAVREIYREGIATGNATFESEAPEWDAWDAAHLPTCRLVAMLAQAVVGWAALSPVSRRAVYAGVAEVSVYVAAFARGAGTGRRLLEALVVESERHGIWTLQAGIFPENEPSLALHRRAGFRLVGRRERIGALDGRWRDVLLMERRSTVVEV